MSPIVARSSGSSRLLARGASGVNSLSASSSGGVLLLAIPDWVLRSGSSFASLDVDFVNNRAWLSEHTISIDSLLVCAANSSDRYYTQADGTLITFAANTLRYGTNGLLVEPSRTNLLLRSQELDDSGAWTPVHASVSVNATTAPDGTLTADKIVEDTAAAEWHRCNQTVSAANGQYTYSIYVKGAGRDYCILSLADGLGGEVAFIVFLTTGQIYDTNIYGTDAAFTGIVRLTETLADGWVRVMVTATSTQGSTLTVSVQASNFQAFYTGNGVSGVYAWGAQLEAGSKASSHIATTSASATRAADIITFSDLIWFNGTNDTLYAEWVGSGINNAKVWALDAANDKLLDEQVGDIGISARIADATAGCIAGPGSIVKAAARLALNNFGIVMNGGSEVTDISEAAPGTLTASRLGCDLSGVNQLNGYIRRVACFKGSALAAAALIELSKPTPFPYAYTERALALKSTQTTGSISASSNELTVADASGFTIGDSIIIAVGGEAGAGLRGSKGVGGSWPTLSYADATERDADVGQADNTYAWLRSTGVVYRFVSGSWITELSGRTYYTNKAVPKALVATVTNKVGNVLTLDAAASATATNASVYFDNVPVIDAAVALGGLHILLSAGAGDFALSDRVLIQGKHKWGLQGAGRDSTRFIVPDGVFLTASVFAPSLCSEFQIGDLAVVGNARNNGFGLGATVTETDLGGNAYPFGIFYGANRGGAVHRIRVTDVFMDGVAAQTDLVGAPGLYGSHVWAYNCEIVVTEPLLSYIQWMFQWVECTGGGCQDCNIDSIYLTAGYESFGGTGCHFIRCTARNASWSLNAAGAWVLDTPDITIETNSQYPAVEGFGPAFSSHNPLINVNTNASGPTVDLGGEVINPTMLQNGFINSDFDSLRGLVVGVDNPNVTVEGGIYTAPDYQSPSALFGPWGFDSTGANTDLSDFTVVGAPPPGIPNISVTGGGGSSITNCTAQVIVGP